MKLATKKSFSWELFCWCAWVMSFVQQKADFLKIWYGGVCYVYLFYIYLLYRYGGVESIRIHPRLMWTPDLLLYNRFCFCNILNILKNFFKSMDVLLIHKSMYTLFVHPTGLNLSRITRLKTERTFFFSNITLLIHGWNAQHHLPLSPLCGKVVRPWTPNSGSRAEVQFGVILNLQ